MVALFVLLTIVAFLLADAVVLWVHRRRAVEPLASPVAHHLLADLLPEPELPGGVFLSPSHLWVGLQASGDVRIGLDPLVRATLGAPDRVDLPAIGSTVHKGGPLFSARWGTRSVLFHSPADGQVLQGVPATAVFSEDSYVLSLQPAHAQRDLKTLPLAEDARRWFSEEWSRFRDFVAARSLQASPVMALPDGGKPAPGWLQSEPDETWDHFVESFLNQTEAGGQK